MPTATAIVTVLAGIVAVLAVVVYFFGIPPELKRKMENEALKTMGENKASYVVKDQINKLPASDQEDIKDLKKGLGNALGGGLQNPLGKTVGDVGDDLTRDFTGR
ncbi:hypothetical protein W97_03432 [Coniosporium apollinis CBS 100218]|uniref:Uncharacterized protein n=1 Tax=Coniosporium apollinis (strain CBS 100218) TaxID=1168221 RepID=R7YQL9_CONA1|nr:uncharacterized protein W97_03432 [Coniosporium apollinis CBS 100218]EON64202.1 hypothetical protein W97_03432 [Coniosporium apollinis CBS 100218]